MSLSMTKTDLAKLAGFDYKRLNEIDKKLPDGKKLFAQGDGNKYDLANFIQKWAEYNADRYRQDQSEPTATKIEISRIAGYSDKQLTRIDKSLPEEEKLFVKSEDGKYDLAIFMRRWVKYNVEREASDDYMDLDLVKAKHEVVKTKKTELEVARLKGQLIDVQDVKRAWGDVLNPLVQNLINLPGKLAPVTVMMDNTELIAGIWDQEIRTILQQAAEAPLPDYANEDETEGGSEDDMEA